MTTLNLNDDLMTAVKAIALQKHTTAEELIADAVREMIEDYHDIQAAEAALKRIDIGEDRTYTLDEVEVYLNESDH